MGGVCSGAAVVLGKRRSAAGGLQSATGPQHGLYRAETVHAAGQLCPRTACICSIRTCHFRVLIRCMTQLCIHRTRIAQQRKVNGTGISLSKTIKRQAFNKDRRLRLTATTKPNGRKSTSLIDFSLPPRTPPRSSAAARGDAPAAGSVAEQDVVRVGGHVVALSGDAGSEQVDEDVDFERHDGASDVSHDDGSVHSDEDVLSGQESDEGGQACGGDAPKQLRDDARDMQHDLHCHDSLETHPLPALSSSERAPPHSAASSSSAAGEGWDNLSPFADVDVVAAAAKDGGVGEGRIALLPLDGLLFHDVPM
jgi:hypothetical protein